MNDAIKAGRRHSASDEAIMKAMAGEMKGYLKTLGDTQGQFSAKMSDYLKALGFEDSDEDGAVTPAEAAAQAEDDDEDAPPPLPPAVKALDLAARAELVADAVLDALADLRAAPADDLGAMAGPVGAILAAAGHAAHEQAEDALDEEAEVYVYEEYAVLCLEGADYQVPYAFEAGGVVIGDPSDWARVEREWKPVPGAPSYAQAALGDVPESRTEGDNQLTPPEALMGGAVKMLDDGVTVEGCAVRWGSPDEPDLSSMRDFFTKSTDFWLGAWDRRPILYHHALDPETADAPVIGAWVKAWADDTGIWLQGQLDKAHKYYSAIKELIAAGALRLSSDSAPHLVRRERQPNGTNQVTRWPLLAASLTPTAAEPRLAPVAAKTLPDSPEAPTPTRERHTRAQADGDAARRLALEIDLLELENV